MPLSTSSFSRAPRGTWLRLLGASVLTALIVLAGFEFLYRSHGHRPSVTDTRDGWAAVRASVGERQDDSNVVVLIGASRMLTGFGLATFNKRYPKKQVFQLAAEGRWPVATLQDLSQSEFAGTVIMSITAQSFLDKFWNDQKTYVDHYHKAYLTSFDRRINTSIRTFMQSHVTLMRPSLHPKLIALSLLKTGNLPKPHYIQSSRTREKSLDFKSGNMGFRKMADNKNDGVKSRFEKKIKGWNISFEQWRTNISRIKKMVTKITDKGGQVVFIHLPTSTTTSEMFEHYMPRRLYWDKITEYTGAPTLHFLDNPILQELNLPDGSHIDKRDKPLLTREILKHLDNKGIM